MFASPCVKLIIGPDALERIVPEAVLCDASEYFRAALKGAFQEAHTKIVTIKDADVVTFDALLHFMACKTICFIEGAWTTPAEELKLLIKAAILADRLTIVGAGVSVEQTLFNSISNIIEDNRTIFTYKNTCTILGLPRQHLVRVLYANLVAEEMLIGTSNTFNMEHIVEYFEFFAEVLKVVIRLQGKAHANTSDYDWALYKVALKSSKASNSKTKSKAKR